MSFFKRLSLIGLFCITSSPASASCPQYPESWDYISWSNECSRRWDGAGEFRALSDCLDSRSQITRTWGVFSHQKRVRFWGDRLDSFFQSNASEGKIFANLYSVRGLGGISSVEYEEDEMGSTGFFLPATEQQIDKAKKNPSWYGCSWNRCGGYLLENNEHESPWIDLKKEYIHDVTAWTTVNSHPSVSADEAFNKTVQKCSGNKQYYWNSRWGIWQTDSNWRDLQCVEISSSDYLISEVKSCNGLCPKVDQNLSNKPKCDFDDGGGGGNNDEESCPDLNITVRALPARRVRVRVDEDWCLD